MTLLELMIALMLVGVMVALGASTISDWAEYQRAATSARSIADAFSLARAEALRTGSNHILAFDIVSNTNLGTLGADIVIANDGPLASSNCQIASSEVIQRVRLERGVDFGATVGLVAPNDPGSTSNAATGTSFQDAGGTAGSWVMFGADGLPRRFTPNTSSTPPCAALGPAGQAAAAIYVSNTAREYAVVMTPLGLARLHRYIPGSPNRWTP